MDAIDGGKHRMFLMSDLENEPDDSQMLVRLLMYANEVDIEGLVAVTSRWLQNRVHPESIVARVEAYGQVRDTLLQHAPGWPTAADLLARVGSGPVSDKGWGMDAVGDGNGTDGTALFLAALTNDDSRPLHVCITAGANCLAQALWDLRAQCTAEDFAAYLSRIRVYDDSGQDNAGAWMCHTYPDLFYVRGQYQPFALYGGDFASPVISLGGPYTWEPYEYSEKGQDDWATEHIRTGHGPLGALYPQRRNAEGHYWSLEGGNTSSWIGLINKGLYDPGQITWGGWGGRFTAEKQLNVAAGQRDVPPTEEPYKPYTMYMETTDTWSDGETTWTDSIYAPIWRWRRAYTNEIRARMDWCVAPFDEANHNPIAAFDGDTRRTIVRLRAAPGETLTLDASASSDPDGDPLTFKWYVYPEPGTYKDAVSVAGDDRPVAELPIPRAAAGSQLHVILEVTDDNAITNLTSYRRVVIDVAGG